MFYILVNGVCTTLRSLAFLPLLLQAATSWKGTQPSRWSELTRDIPYQIMASPQKRGFQELWPIFLINCLGTGLSTGDREWLPMHHLFSSIFSHSLNNFLAIVLSLPPSFLAFLLLPAHCGFVGAMSEEPHGALLPTRVIPHAHFHSSAGVHHTH